MILAFDPGIKNFAWSALDNDLKIHGIGKIQTPISEFNNIRQIYFFRKQIKFLLERYKPKYVIIERFQNRGKFTGAQGEFVGVMIGHIQSFFYKLECIGAMEWKGYFRRTILTDKIAKTVLREEYKKLAKSKRKKKPKKLKYHFEMENFIESKSLTEHEIDALGIALFKLEQIKKKQGLLWKLNDSLIRRKR